MINNSQDAYNDDTLYINNLNLHSNKLIRYIRLYKRIFLSLRMLSYIN